MGKESGSESTEEVQPVAVDPFAEKLQSAEAGLSSLMELLGANGVVSTFTLEMMSRGFGQPYVEKYRDPNKAAGELLLDLQGLAKAISVEAQIRTRKPTENPAE